MAAQSSIVVTVSVLAFICTGHILEAKSASGDASWDYMVFAQQWPPSVCLDSKLTHQHTCKIGANVSTWTVHGLWPTKEGSHGPSFCNNSAKFDPKALQPIMPQLLKYWPNLYAESPQDEFWEHEWTKHGTCAESQPSMNSEYKYFNQGLKLNRQLDLLSMFAKYNIVPKDYDAYQYFDMLNALEKSMGGHKPKLQCVYDKATKTQYIAQIELCVGKDFQVVECKSNIHVTLTTLRRRRRSQNSLDDPRLVGSVEPCRDTDPVTFPQIHPTSS